MKRVIIIACLASLMGCQKSDLMVPDETSALHGKRPVMALSTKSQFPYVVRRYQYKDRRIIQMDYMDEGYSFTYNWNERKITLTGWSPDYYKIYYYQKNGQLKSMEYVTRGMIMQKQQFRYKGPVLTSIESQYDPDSKYSSASSVHTQFISPWLQKTTSTWINYNSGEVVSSSSDTVLIRWTKPLELTVYDMRWRKKEVLTYSSNIKDPAYNLPALPDFEEITDRVPCENIQQAWLLANPPRLFGLLLIRHDILDQGI